MNLTEEARKLRNAYAREQYRKNRDRERKRQEDYWNRKAAAAAAQAVKEAVDAAREDDNV